MDIYTPPQARQYIPHIRQVYIFDVKVVDLATIYNKTERPFMVHYHTQGVECDEVCELVE